MTHQRAITTGMKPGPTYAESLWNFCDFSTYPIFRPFENELNSDGHSNGGQIQPHTDCRQTTRTRKQKPPNQLSTMNALNSIIALFVWGSTATACCSQHKTNDLEPNTIAFEKTDYGLIFTTITVNEKTVKAMIDFGDQHKLQLSSTLIDELTIETEQAGYQVSDVFGNTWDVQKGTVRKLVVGAWEEYSVEFTSQKGEMESVSQQIGTEFHAVLGWGYFKDYFTEIDYSASLFTLYNLNHSVNDELFKVNYQNDANQLIIPATVYGQHVRFMIDTGSPVTVIDSSFNGTIDDDTLKFTIAKNDFEIKVYSQDLSVLADLEVVCILGGDFLSHWKVTVDPVNSALLFKK